MLTVENIHSYYDKSHVLEGVSLQVNPGELVTLLGRNGAGKTTTLRSILGIICPRQGQIRFNGQDMVGRKIFEIAREGLALVPEHRGIFRLLSVEENLRIAQRKSSRWQLEDVYSMFPRLKERRKNAGHALSGGERQRLALAAVLAIRPKVLALDEPISQMDPRGAMELLQVLQKLNTELGITIIVVEHRLHEVMPMCKQVMVMEQGRIAWQGSQQEAFCQPDVFLRQGLRIPQTVHICHRLGLTSESATVEAAYAKISQAYPGCSVQARPILQQCIADPAEPVIEVSDLEFQYDQQKGNVLDGINLTVRRGQFVVLMGNNGAGKSTLLHHICGLQKTQKGQVKLLGQPVKTLDRRVGMVMQNPDLMLFNSTVAQEISFGLQHGLGRGKNLGNWRPLLERIGLGGLEDRFPLALSQGQRVRVAIASLLACQPDIMLLDEPTTGQDLGHIDDIIELLQEFTQTGGTVILCTHDTEVAARYAERVIVMTSGRVVADASPREVFSQDEVLSKTGLRPPTSLQLSRRLYGGCALGVEEVVRHVQQTDLASHAG